MRGQLPSTPEGSRKTSLLITWLPLDRSLLDALRPFKARARGRRIKELATLGAEVEKLGFRIEVVGDTYRVLAPASQALIAAAPPFATAAVAIPNEPRAADAASSLVDQQNGAGIAPAPPNEDALSFASGFM